MHEHARTDPSNGAIILDRERHQATDSRVDVALGTVQEAQELIDQAIRLLSVVPGMHCERKKLAYLSGQLTRAWLELAATANRRRRPA